MKWFNGITNLKDLHKLYVKLAMVNHPDKGGSVEAMKEINIEYRELREKFKSGYSFIIIVKTPFISLADYPCESSLQKSLNFCLFFVFCRNFDFLTCAEGDAEVEGGLNFA